MRQILFAGAIAIWLAVVLMGFAKWQQFDSTPGLCDPCMAAAEAGHSTDWQIVMFLHPHCPCSRASLRELAELADEAGPILAVRIVFVRPPESPAGWEQSALWDVARQIQKARISCDENGWEASRSGAVTSGHVVLYQPNGDVAFVGGLTSARGREGRADSRQIILDLIRGQASRSSSAPVYGCDLLGESPAAANSGDVSCHP